MPGRKTKSTNKSRSQSDKGNKGGLDSVKETAEHAYEETKEGIEHAVENVKKTFGES